MTNTTGPVQRADRVLGRMVLRVWAVVAFVAAAASVGFGAVVLVAAPVPGVILLLLGALFLWLGVRAWRNRATLGEVLSRDYQPGTKSGPPGDRRS
jgi:threonine/homoserine/homoserine lactone efflux protein